MSQPPLLQRIKRARVVQVVLVYLGASWGVLQVADFLQGLLSLPSWILPVAIILLLVGMVVILATAWIQSLPSTSTREEAGEIPTDWQIAPGDVWASLRSGKLPHLTWGRTVLGGGVALSLLFGIYLVKPSPFCVLDEVDAPLDENNIGRFIKLLQDFKGQTQFVVITHNPRTIEAADWIYGVTMEEPGVSTIVGVRLEEALHAAGAA